MENDDAWTSVFIFLSKNINFCCFVFSLSLNFFVKYYFLTRIMWLYQLWQLFLFLSNYQDNVISFGFWCKWISDSHWFSLDFCINRKFRSFRNETNNYMKSFPVDNFKPLLLTHWLFTIAQVNRVQNYKRKWKEARQKNDTYSSVCIRIRFKK